MPVNLTTEQKKHLAQPVQSLVDRVERVEQFWAPAVINMHENWRYYWGMYPHLGQGQWPLSAIPKMIQSGRQLTQYNFILPIIDSLLAVMMKMPMEPDFIPLDETAKQLTTIAKHMIYADRELMDWNTAFRKFFLFGLIFEGVMKISVSDRYDPLGNIAFETCPQGSVFFDPFWKSYNRKDLKKVYKKSWMSAEEVYNVYGGEHALLDARAHAVHGEEYGPFLGINPYDSSSTQLGTMHQIYEEYFMKPVDRSMEIIMGPDGEVEMPDILDEDKPAYMDKFMPGWDKTSVYEHKYKVEECFLRTACPTLAGHTLLVDNKRIEEQIGSPPFFVWAAARENGQSRGMVDSLKDPQTNQNFIEAEILRKIQVEGGGGSKFVDKSLFLTGEDKKFERYSNRPDMKFYVKPGTLRKGLTPSTPVETTGIPSAFYQNIQHIQRDIIPNVSKRPPVSMGQADQGTDPSGRLFRLMGAEADNQIETMVISAREIMNDIYEADLLLAGQVYSNEMIPREFTHKGKTLVANEPIELGSGEVMIRNDVRGLMRMRHKILINEKQASPSDKANTANQLLNFIKVVPPENIGTRTVINHEVIKNIEQLNDDTQAELEEMAALEKDLAKSKLKLEKARVDMEAMAIQNKMGGSAPVQFGGRPRPQPGYELPPPENVEPGAPMEEKLPNEEGVEQPTERMA